MDERPPEDLSAETPETLLDAFRAHPEWTERRRDEQLDRLIARFPADRLLVAVRSRIRDLNGADGEAILRLVEALAGEGLLRELAEALAVQPGLSPERAWGAFELLDGAGLLREYPDLLERRDEIEEFLSDGEGSLDELAEQIEGDPDGAWLALQGLGAVEAEVRPQIVAGLADVAVGPGLVEFLRLLGFAHDPGTRAAALAALERPDRDDPSLRAAWTSLAADHPDPAVVRRARRWLGLANGTAVSSVEAGRHPDPIPVRTLVTALDGKGRGTIVLGSRRDDAHATAAFLCDMDGGVVRVSGRIDADPEQAGFSFEDLAGVPGLDAVEGVPELALRLLAGSVLLCGPEAPPSLRYWLERAAHPSFRAAPFPAPFPGWDPSSLPLEEMPARALAVLDSCPDWLDDSPLTYEIAEEIALREGDPSPDPRRDAGAYRYLFEHRLLEQLEHYRRMLYWMSSFWQAGGRDDLGRSALALAWQLSDAQHAVPGHPFTVALTTRSLGAAQAHLGRSRDPRRSPPTTGE